MTKAVTIKKFTQPTVKIIVKKKIENWIWSKSEKIKKNYQGNGEKMNMKQHVLSIQCRRTKMKLN